MIQTPVPHCDCCGLPIGAEAGDDCPRCQYPVKRAKEEHFLETSLRDLTRVAEYGGAYITITDLIQRYKARLSYLRSLREAVVPIRVERANTPAPSVPVALLRRGSTQPLPVLRQATNEGAPVPAQEPVPPAETTPVQPRARTFSPGALSSDALITIVASLGGFFVLVGALSFVATTANLQLAFLVVFLVHAVFGLTGLITHRFPNFRVISGIYTTIFALLVPLVGFSAYRLVAGSLIEFSVPGLIALAALYAAVVYSMLAIVQRFELFAYLGVVALLVADLATARTFQWGYWWWPCAAMVLAFPALSAVARPSGHLWPFNSSGLILRTPVLVLLYSILAGSVLSALVILQYSFMNDLQGVGSLEVRLSLFALVWLLFAWTALLLWLTRRVRWTPVLAYLLLACVLAGAYTLKLEAIGYALALTAVALLYHGLNRVAGRLLAPLAPLSLSLDQIALLLTVLVPFISSPFQPFKLLARAYGIPAVFPSPLHFAADWRTAAELVAVGVCLAITLSVTFQRAGLSKIPAKAGWCWLLLLSGFLLAWEYSLVVLSLNIEPMRAFVGLTLALLVGAVAVRKLIGKAWANPLDLLAMAALGATLALSLAQNPDTITTLLLGFAIILYGVLLYQGRPAWLFLPFALILLAMPLLVVLHPFVMLLIGLLLPLMAVPVHRFVSLRWRLSLSRDARGQRTIDVFEWPLLIAGLLYGIVSSYHDMVLSRSTIEVVTGLHVAVALQVTLLAAVWYGAAALARQKLWLIPAVGFAAWALLTPSNDFWALAGVTVGLTLLGVGIGRVADRGWALPFYSAALLGAFMSGYTGIAQGHVAATGWVLLGFAALAHGVGVIEREPAVLWIMPLLATWAVYDAASIQGDLYRAPLIALASAGLGIGIGLMERRTKTTWTAYALPFYAASLASMVLTGIYGTLANINHPFYGAIPDALLLYAAIAFGVAVFERQAAGNWLTAGFAVWGTLLAVRLTPQYMLAVGMGAALAGLLVGRLVHIKSALKQTNAATTTQMVLDRFTWSWPWYVTALLAAVSIGGWSMLHASQPPTAFIPYDLLAFTALAVAIMLVERAPELLVIPTGLAAWTIWLWQPPLDFTLLMVVYSLLCLLVFASQFVWRLIAPASGGVSATALHNVLALGGQLVVVLAIMTQSGLSPDAGWLVHVGAGALLELALLLFLFGIVHHQNVARSLTGSIDEQTRESQMEIARSVLHWCNYGAGLLLSLVVSWELLAFHQTRFDVLTLAPASYLIVIAPFLLRDEVLPERQASGQVAALAGAALLLLPALWFSFNDANTVPTLILIGESLALLLLGMITRLRIFILSSAALIVVGTLRVLFLSIPPSLPLLLMAFGSVLVALATALILARHRLQTAWTRWE